jgi:hypothetical protein
MMANESWKLVDGLEFISLGVSAAWLHLCPETEARWDASYQGFWILEGSRADMWLKLKGVGLKHGR